MRGNRNTISVVGPVSAVEVRGNNNTIVLQGVEETVLRSNDNRVLWDPDLNDNDVPDAEEDLDGYGVLDGVIPEVIDTGNRNRVRAEDWD